MLMLVVNVVDLRITPVSFGAACMYNWMSDKIDKGKIAKIKEEAAKLGTSYYKFV